ncbi:hypothetical protein BaRGS_00028012, partial [Batillaria attramentaria]
MEYDHCLMYKTWKVYELLPYIVGHEIANAVKCDQWLRDGLEWRNTVAKEFAYNYKRGLFVLTETRPHGIQYREINRVRVALFHHQGKKELNLPEPHGPVVTLSEKLFVPVKDHPDFNFVGRILGPRGMTAKELEQYTGCKIMVRGKGSMRDKGKEEQNRGKANWEHLNEDLHVLITVEDTRNRAELKLAKAVEE